MGAVGHRSIAEYAIHLKRLLLEGIEDERQVVVLWKHEPDDAGRQPSRSARCTVCHVGPEFDSSGGGYVGDASVVD